ncbi:MAG: phospholipase D-like domain-containing protein [Leptospira sp.]|nr:phospholipase D-like domain-containing protein [Leptospira sp.]
MKVLMILRKFVQIPFCFLILIHCQKEKTKEELNLDILSLLGVENPIFLFSYPGRDSPAENKTQVVRTIVSMIQDAKFEIVGYIYGLDDLDILISLREAKQRGVRLEIQGDKDEDYKELASFGIPIKIWNGSGIHHTKIIITDRRNLFLGTGNFTSTGLVRDNNLYWKQNIQESEYKILMDILREKNELGLWKYGHKILYFAPESGRMIQDKMLEAVKNAKNRIRYMIYTHYDPILSHALIQACDRGVIVEGIYSKPINPEAFSLANELRYPCQIYEDGNEDSILKNGNFVGGLLHHKTMIIDENLVLTGSYNFTVSARDENREYYTEFDEVKAVAEVGGEWKRVKQLAKRVMPSEQEVTNRIQIYHLPNWNGNHLLIGRFSSRGVSFDRNSSGLSLEWENSFNLLEDRPEYERIEASELRRNYIDISLPSEYDFLGKEMRPMGEFKVLMLWDRIRIIFPSKMRVSKVYTWDGKSKPATFMADENQDFSMSLYEKLGKEQWLAFETERGVLFGCSKKKDTKLSRFIMYLKQKQVLQGFGETRCFSF